MPARALLGAMGLALTLVMVQRAPASTGETTPPSRLAETGLYAPDGSGAVDPRNRPFSPQYPLWTDGATKRRWVYLPPGAAIDARDLDDWDFPVGTRFWKEFSFGGRKVETRLLWKASTDRWVGVSYAWNDDETEATLVPERGAASAAEVAPGRRHTIPSRADCAACHGEEQMRPLGFTALQLSPDRDPLAIHGEPLDEGMITLRTLVDDGRLAGAAADLAARPPRIVARSPRTRAVLGYLLANCGTCHNGRGEIAAVAPVLRARELQLDGDAVAARFIGHTTRWQLPGRPDGTSRLIDPHAPDASALLARMRSRRPSSQMPPLGTVVRDEAAVDTIARWIAVDLLPSHATN